MLLFSLMCLCFIYFFNLASMRYFINMKLCTHIWSLILLWLINRKQNYYVYIAYRNINPWLCLFFSSIRRLILRLSEWLNYLQSLCCSQSAADDNLASLLMLVSMEKCSGVSLLHGHWRGCSPASQLTTAHYHQTLLSWCSCWGHRSAEQLNPPRHPFLTVQGWEMISAGVSDFFFSCFNL